tara:strand:+ start:1210 stop:1968 length:759 start_codon:yes stop_codon:yes gene_type:complete
LDIWKKKMISKIFVIHYTKLIERKEHMTTEINKWGLNQIGVHFEEEYDQEVITDYDVYTIINLEKFKLNCKRSPSKGEISLSIKYKNVLSKAFAFSDDEYILILEDDVIFKQDPIEYINNIIKNCKRDNINFDCVFMGEAAMRVGDDTDIFTKKENNLWPQNPASASLSDLKKGTMTNGLCTVLYTAKAAKKLYNYLNSYKLEYPLDWHFNGMFRDLNFDVYWAKAITEHGSVTAVHDPSKEGLKSSLRENY